MAHSTHKIHEILELDAQNIIEIGHQEREIPAGSGLPDGVAVETRQDMKHSISLPHVEMFNGVPRISETSRVSVRSASFGPSALVVAHRSVSTILADATNITDNDMPQTINHMQDLPQVDLRNADDNFQAPSVFLQEATPIAASPSPLLTNYLSKIAGKSQENLISQASGKPDLAIISQSFRKSILIDEPELEMLSSRTNSKSMYGSVNIQKPTSEYLIFTGAVKTPSFCQVAQQPRFWMRIVQLCLSIGAFLTIFTVDSSSKYHPQLNQSSGSDSLIFISTVSSVHITNIVCRNDTHGSIRVSEKCWCDSASLQ